MTVRRYRELATTAISDVTARGRLPVVVGGTMYYVQSLLRESLLDDDEAAAVAHEGPGGGAGASAPTGGFRASFLRDDWGRV